MPGGSDREAGRSAATAPLTPPSPRAPEPGHRHGPSSSGSDPSPDRTSASSTETWIHHVKFKHRPYRHQFGRVLRDAGGKIQQARERVDTAKVAIGKNITRGHKTHEARILLFTSRIIYRINVTIKHDSLNDAMPIRLEDFMQCAHADRSHDSSIKILPRSH